MRIAEVSNVIEAVPPLTYGGTEYVVSVVTEKLIERHHEVTLFATGDSKTSARLVAAQPQAFGYAQPVPPLLIETIRIRHLINILHHDSPFDIIHNHIYETLGLLPFLTTPMVTTLHTVLSRPEFQSVLTRPEVQNTFFISISDAQRQPLPNLPYLATIYHGLDPAIFPFNPTPGEYLLFLGRISPDKGPEIAVEVARRTKRKLIVAALIDNPESEYSQKILRLFKESPFVEFIGEVNEQQKKELYKNAYAFLMPIQWEEPFGLVVIEALACGTPVVAFNRGSMPEIITEGKTGFIVTSASAMAEAVDKVSTLSRQACRQHVEKHFTIDRMVTQYEKVFSDLLAQRLP
jgi:glycosyltransferase involved in cell wall biosynthesis